MFEFALFCALALRSKVVPACREALGLGLKAIVTGKGEAPGGLLPPHAGKNKNKEIVTATHAQGPKRNFPMHPLVASWLYPDGRAAHWNGKLLV
jgi:hypothetical protein